MIVLPEGRLDPLLRHGLDVLVDLSRLLPAPPASGAMRLAIADQGGEGPAALQEPIAASEGRVVITRGTLRAIGELVTAGAERETTERDRLGRIPTGANALVAAGLEGTPVISTFASRFRQVVAANAGARPFRAVAPWPEGKRWGAAFTHDLDVVALWP